MEEITSKYKEKLGDEQKKSGFGGLLKKVGDSVSGVYNIHFENAPEKRKKDLMNEHQIDLRDSIHLIVDNDRVGSEDSSTIVTDDIFSIISATGLVYGGMSMCLQLSLERCQKIEHKLDMVFLYVGEDADHEEFSFPLSALIEKDAEVNQERIEPLIDLLNEIFTSKPNNESSKIAEILSIHDDSMREIIAEYVKDYRLPNYRVFAHLAKFEADSGDFEKAEKHLRQAFRSLGKQFSDLKKLKSNPLAEQICDARIELNVVKADICNLRGEIHSAIFDLQELLAESLPDKLLRKVQQRTERLHKRFRESFFEMPYLARKLIYVDDSFPKEKPDSFMGVKADYLPEIKFPPLHPKKGQLYVAHPHSMTEYLPLEGHETELFEERYYELLKLLQSLGATYIKITVLVGDSSQLSISTGKGVEQKASGVGKVLSMGGQFSSDQKSNEKHSHDRKHVFEFTFKPDRAPFVPDDMVWHQHEKLWQSLTYSRTEGNALTAKVNIRSDENRLVSRSDKRIIEQEVGAKCLSSSSKVKVSSSQSETGTSYFELALDVKFESKENLKG
jgi:tetratricopeptide (TPR) repeat protein